MTEDTQKRRTPSQEQRALEGRFKRNAHWVALLGGLIPAVTAAVISVMTAYRGEPEANRAYAILAPQVNAQRASLQAVLSRLAKIEGHYEGKEIGKLEAQIERLIQENKQLRRKTTFRAPISVKKRKPPKSCKAGYVLGQDYKCHHVKRTVATKVRATEQKLRENQAWLQHEKRRRGHLEQRMRVLKNQARSKPQMLLKAVPETLKKADNQDS